MVLIEGAVSLLLISILVLLRQFRSRLLSISRRAFLSISSGFSLLAITAIVRIAREAGFFSTLPLVTEPLIFQLLSTIALITGITLVGSGIATVVSVLVERSRLEQDSWAHLLIIKQVEQLVQVEHRLDNVLTFALEQFASDNAISRGSVVKISPRTGRISVVGSAGEVRLSNSEWLALCRSCGGDTPMLSDGLNTVDKPVHSRLFGGQPSIVVPVMVRRRAVALFALWCDSQSEPNRQLVQSMHVVAGAIARKIERDELALLAEHLSDRNQIRREIERELSSQAELPGAVSAMAGVFKKHLGADVVSLLWYQPELSRMSRITVGDSGALTEHKIPMPESHTVGGWVLAHRAPMLIIDASDSTVALLDGPLAVAGIQSAVAVPVPGSTSIVGALILGSRASGAFAQRHLEVAADCSWSVGCLLRESASSRNAELHQRETERTISRIAAPINQFGSEAFLVEIANLIARELNWDMVRISAVDDKGQFIESLAAAGPAFGSASVPAQGTLVLSLLDRHREVIESGMPISATTSDPTASVSRIELDHVFGSRCQGLQVIPLIFDGRLVGLISLGSAGETIHTMSPLEEALLDLISGNLAIAIAGRSTPTQPSFIPSGYTKAIAANKAERELRNRLRSPLTGILGSLELIKGDTSDLRHDRAKYIEIIDRSARRMQKYLEQPESVR